MLMKACLITLLQRSTSIQDLGGSILLTGDFNARTNAADTYVDCRYFGDHMPDTLPWGMTSRRFCLRDIIRTRGG